MDITLRQMQEIQLAILLEVDKLCASFAIKYFLDFGTLLGARRHQGFIPWDDDIDISMSPTAVTLLEESAPASLPPHLRVIPHIVFPTSVKVIDTRYYVEERSRLTRSGTTIAHPGIDIFPFGFYRRIAKYLPTRTVGLITHKQPTAKVRARLLFAERRAQSLAFWAIAGVPSVALDAFARFVERDGGINWESGEADIVLGHGLASGTGTKNLPIAAMFPLREIEFEGKTFLAPSDTDGYLTRLYGDWQAPVQSPQHHLRAWTAESP